MFKEKYIDRTKVKDIQFCYTEEGAWKDHLLFVRAKGDNGQFGEWQRYMNQNALVEEIVSFINDMEFSGIAIIAKESLLKIISDRVYNEFKD